MGNLLKSLLIVVGVCSPALAGMGVYWQEPTTTPPGVATDYVSQRETSAVDPLGEIGRVYDNFTLSQGYDITDVHWRGSYDRQQFRDIEGFTIGFWSDNAGQPGSIISSQYIPGKSDETFVGFEIGLDPTLELPIYDYWTYLNQTVWLDPNTPYWLSIVADLPTPTDDDGFWGWHVGIGPDGTSVQDFDLPPFDGVLDPAEGREFLNTDMAFHLTAVNTIPEPASVAVWAALLVGIVGTVSLKKRRLR